eukprot:CAMPEP_0198138872 /NCGR_PEP_ID=MMETSP1443-20131203/2256_1 /TAXON_ID=186043 /ORGANISM="Entomoneis sp., Strain CCMP2396" /LENGTH=121 /DNA_ID=CAMNT_0043800821 /DNA_START=113 /DNA_END=478 /DNA_ORIENTATION=+
MTSTILHETGRQDWWAGPQRKPRSRAIAIKQLHDKRITEPYPDSNSGGSGPSRMYDFATWQMYNRITDHRQRNPLSQGYQPSAEVAEQEERVRKVNRRTHQSPTKQVEFDSFEGGVFDFDP